MALYGGRRHCPPVLCRSPVPLPVSPTLYAVYLGTACCRIHTVSLPVSMYGTTSGTLLLVLRSGGPEVSVGQQLATTPHLYLSTSTQLGCTPYLVPVSPTLVLLYRSSLRPYCIQ